MVVASCKLWKFAGSRGRTSQPFNFSSGQGFVDVTGARLQYYGDPAKPPLSRRDETGYTYTYTSPTYSLLFTLYSLPPPKFCPR